jgi:hypothetical protein
MMRRPDRVTVTATDAVGLLRAIRPNMGPDEMLNEIRYVFHPKVKILARDKDGRVSASTHEIGYWMEISKEIRLLKDLGFTFCQLTEALGALRHQLPGWRDKEGITKPGLPPCACRYGT